MAHMFGRIPVEDYSHFRGIVDDHEEMRQSAGVTAHTVYRSVDDPNEVTITLLRVGMAVKRRVGDRWWSKLGEWLRFSLAIND